MIFSKNFSSSILTYTGGCRTRFGNIDYEKAASIVCHTIIIPGNRNAVSSGSGYGVIQRSSTGINKNIPARIRKYFGISFV